jgi:hypothetical protein
MNIFESATVPADEIEAAGDALRILWQSDENQAALKETGHGANWFWQARLALEAAAAIRGRHIVKHGTEQ